MRVCVIGDSHTAAWKRGLPSVKGEFPGIEVTFYAAGFDTMEDLLVEGNCLVSGTEKLRKSLRATSGGKARVSARDFDLYVLCGLKLEVDATAYLIVDHRGDQDEVSVEDVCAVYRGVVAYATMTKLRKITKAPALIVPTPMPGPQRRVDTWPALTGGEVARVASLFDQACESLASSHDVQLVRQPVETLGGDQVTTREEYCLGAARLADGPDDQRHMNAAFGAMALRKALMQGAKIFRTHPLNENARIAT